MTDFDLDPAVRPADDLFRHVNGRWLATAQIADDRAAAGAFVDLRDESEIAIRDIVTGLAGAEPGTDAERIEHLYGSFIDAEKVDALGLAPLAPILAEIDEVASVDDLLGYFARSSRRGTGAPFGFDVDADPGDPAHYALFLGQAGIGLPDEEYYRLEQHAAIRDAYRDHIERSLTLAEVTSSASGLIFELEAAVAATGTRCAPVTWPPSTTRCRWPSWTPPACRGAGSCL